MSFIFNEFYRANRRVLIWLILAVVLWLLRDFFDLIFVTFALIFFATPLVRLCEKWTKLPRRLSLILVYILFLLILISFVRYITPRVIVEANHFVSNLGAIKERIVEARNEVAERYPDLNRAVRGYTRSLLDDDTLTTVHQLLAEERQRLAITEVEINSYIYDESISSDKLARIETYLTFQDTLLIESYLAQQASLARQYVPQMINLLYKILETLLLSLLFSFLILIDIVSLRKQAQSLQMSRLRDFYLETAQPIARFGYVVGRGIQAQAMIAAVNTALTMAGLLILSVPSVAVLSLIVFVCGFIPVLGTFISTAPILLVAFNESGLQLALGVLLLIILIHALEAYVLNPLIYGRHFKLNPVIVLIILLVGYHLFGIWGLLLGVPITQYFMHHVFGIQVWREDRLDSV